MRVKTTRLSTIIVTSLLVLTAASAVYAEGNVKDGWYLGLQAVRNGMSGDFDDSTFLVGGGTIFDVPDVDDGMGFGAILGFKRDVMALEFGYQRTIHDTSSILFGDHEAALNVIDLNFRYDIYVRDRLRPYVLLGLGIPWLTIEDSALGSSIEDETFTGFGLNLGGGVAYYFNTQWAVTGGLIYRWNWFSGVEGYDISDSKLETTLGLTLGIIYAF